MIVVKNSASYQTASQTISQQTPTTIKHHQGTAFDKYDHSQATATIMSRRSKSTVPLYIEIYIIKIVFLCS